MDCTAQSIGLQQMSTDIIVYARQSITLMLMLVDSSINMYV